MNIKKKNLVLIALSMFIFGALLSCGIFAVVSKSVSFNLALKLDPKIYFALELQIDYNGDGDYADTQNNINESSTYKIFNNKTGADVVSWATVNQNCIVLNQVLAGNILSDLSINSKFKITVTNLTEKTSNEAEEYLHLTLDYDNQKEVFKADNGYGAVNMECGVASGDTSATKTFTLIPQTTLLDGYIQIPFLAEIDGYRYTATITTENCEVVHARKTFKLGESYRAEFWADTICSPAFTYEITINGEPYNANTSTNILEIEAYLINGNMIINVTALKVWSGGVATNFSIGDGSEENPFLIYTAEELALMAHLVNNANGATSYTGTATLNGISTAVSQACDSSVTFASAYYELKNDIWLNLGKILEASLEPVFPNGSSSLVWTPIGLTAVRQYTAGFKGFFNGNGYLVKNLYINNTNLEGAGLFCSNVGTIKNVGLVGSFVKAKRFVAGLCSDNAGVISGCYTDVVVISTLSTSNAESIVAGISAYLGYTNKNAQVTDCYNLGNIYSYARHNGGIVGGLGMGDQSAGGVVHKTYNVGKIHNYNSSAYNGGITGTLTCGQTSYSYNFGNINAGGSVIGVKHNSNTFSNQYLNNYYLSGTHNYIIGYYNNGSGVYALNDSHNKAETKDQMFAQMETDWDFENTWGYVAGENDGYPILRVFYPNATIYNSYVDLPS